MAALRLERDTMGEVGVPQEARYGAQTQRAVDNFPISGYRFPRPFFHALGLIKACAARVNGLPAVERVAGDVASGLYDDQFVVDVFQTGSGTSTNMNVNEVIAHLSGGHPNDDVNRAQSSNDVIPTAIHLAARLEIERDLLPSITRLETSLTAKAGEFADVVKIGRTHLQDAVPMFLGQEFSGYARQAQLAGQRIRRAAADLEELALGGTAVGTGINTRPGFARDVIALLAERTGIAFREAENHFEAQASKDAACLVSGAIRTWAVGLTKIANDLRWLGSGPRCGLGELRLPETQPGSSIMPGKVNPVIAESALMVCAQVIGYDATIAWGAAAGNFELNVMMPVIAWCLLESIRLLAAASRNLAERCVDSLEADRERIQALAEGSLAMVTALTPEIGYDRAAAIAKEAWKSRRTIREVAREATALDTEKLDRILDPRRQASGPSNPTL